MNRRMNKIPLRIGIIGLGVGQKHIAGFELDPRCQVTMLCDIDEERLAKVSAQYPRCDVTHLPDVVLEHSEIDIVSIASWDNAHAEQVLKAISAGKHVFVEKPLCCCEEEFTAITQALSAHPELLLSSNLILRKYPRFARLKTLIDKGTMGSVYYLEADYNYGRMEKIHQGWRGSQPNYSVIHGGGIHVVDLVLWLTNSLPVEVTAIGSRKASLNTTFSSNDTVVALLRFHDGTIAKISVNFPCAYPHFHDVVVFGTLATWRNERDSALLYRSKDPEVIPERFDDPYPGSLKSDLIPSFVQAILDGKKAEVQREDVLNAMSVSLAIERAAETGTPQSIDYR